MYANLLILNITKIAVEIRSMLVLIYVFLSMFARRYVMSFSILDIN